MHQSTVVITAPKDLIPYTSIEIKKLGYSPIWKNDSAVAVNGCFADTLRLNLWLRTAHHVLYTLKEISCRDLTTLYRNIYSIPWETIIPSDGYVSVVSKVDTPTIRDHRIVNLKCKDAIVDRISQKKGRRPDSGPEKEGVVISIFWKKERCIVYLDTSGAPLSKRGYRKIPLSAPMQETLAAGVLYAARYDKNQHLLNPMCGSGTIAIEAAMIATNTAPGSIRKNYGFKQTLLYNKEEWISLLKEAKSNITTFSTPIISATDNREEVISAAEINVNNAGFSDIVQFNRCDFRDSPVTNQKGIVVFNPEYGIRLGNENQLAATYREIGNFMKLRCSGYRGFVFTANTKLAGKIGLKSRKRYTFKSGKIDCRLYEYDLYGKKNDF